MDDDDALSSGAESKLLSTFPLHVILAEIKLGRKFNMKVLRVVQRRVKS